MDQGLEIDKIWNELCRYWTFLNYTLLAHLAKKCGDKELVEDFECYKVELRKFRCKTLLRSFAGYLRENKVSLSNKKLKKLVVRWQKSWETCTLEDLEMSKENVTKKFFIPDYTFYIMDAVESSVSITWAVPEIIIAAVKESFHRIDMIEFRRKQAILSVCIGEERILDQTNYHGSFSKDTSTPGNQLHMI
jgi:hypothetical protein